MVVVKSLFGPEKYRTVNSTLIIIGVVMVFKWNYIIAVRLTFGYIKLYS